MRIRLSVAAIGMFFAAGIAWMAFAGPLDPPSGPPAPTYKTLDEVRPGTIIDALPRTITESGTYLVASNLSGTLDTDGITIDADDVTIDLNGFSLRGFAGSTSGHGINVLSGRIGAHIRNGTITGWAGQGIEAFFASSTRMDDLRITQNGGMGARIARAAIVTDCAFDSNSNTGLFAIFSCTVDNCTAHENGDVGMNVRGGSSIENSAAVFNLIGIVVESSSARGCSVLSNENDGFRLSGSGSVADACVSRSNTGPGFLVEGSSTLTGCVAVGNGFNDAVAAGFLVTGTGARIDSCHTADNDTGLEVTGDRNLIVRTSFHNNTTRLSNTGTNVIGPFISRTNIATDDRPHANYDLTQ